MIITTAHVDHILPSKLLTKLYTNPENVKQYEILALSKQYRKEFASI